MRLLAFTVHDEATLFPVRETTQIQFTNDTIMEVGSQVMSARVADIPDGTKLNAPIAYSLSQSRTITLEADEYISERIYAFCYFTAASELNYKLINRNNYDYCYFLFPLPSPPPPPSPSSSSSPTLTIIHLLQFSPLHPFPSFFIWRSERTFAEFHTFEGVTLGHRSKGLCEILRITFCCSLLLNFLS